QDIGRGYGPDRRSGPFHFGIGERTNNHRSTCRAVRKERGTRWPRTSARSACGRTGTRRRTARSFSLIAAWPMGSVPWALAALWFPYSGQPFTSIYSEHRVNIDLIIRSGASEVAIALMKDKALSELHREKTERGFAVGDIYLAKVRKVAPGLNAAFVDVGHEKDAFLHYYDLGPQYRNTFKFTKGAVSGSVDSSLLDGWKLDPDIDKNGKIADAISASQSILVQI